MLIICRTYTYTYNNIITTHFPQEELAMIHGKIRALMAANRNDLPPVDQLPPSDKSPGPIRTPKDLVEMAGMEECTW